MAAEDTIQDTISRAWEMAEASQGAAKGYSDSAVTAASGAVFPGDVRNIEEPDLPDAPELQVPDDIASFVDKNLSAYDEKIRTQLAGDLQRYLDTYFPEYDDTLKDVHDWAAARINGLPEEYAAAAFDRFYNKMSEEISDDYALQKQTVIDQWASRGFSLPPGAVNKQLGMLGDKEVRDRQRALAELKMKQADQNFETIKMAVEYMWQIRKHYVDATFDYLRQIISTVDASRNNTDLLVSSISNLQRATVDVYRGEISAEQLMLDYGRSGSGRDLNLNEIFIKAYDASTRNRVDAALAAAKSMGELAGAALSSQNTMATIAHETLAEG